MSTTISDYVRMYQELRYLMCTQGYSIEVDPIHILSLIYYFVVNFAEISSFY